MKLRRQFISSRRQPRTEIRLLFCFSKHRKACVHDCLSAACENKRYSRSLPLPESGAGNDMPIIEGLSVWPGASQPRPVLWSYAILALTRSISVRNILPFSKKLVDLGDGSVERNTDCWFSCIISGSSTKSGILRIGGSFRFIGFAIIKLPFPRD